MKVVDFHTIKGLYKKDAKEFNYKLSEIKMTKHSLPRFLICS